MFQSLTFCKRCKRATRHVFHNLCYECSNMNIIDLIKLNIKELFNYRKLFKNQKNQNKRLRKKINKLQNSLISELKLDVTNEEIAKLRKEVSMLKNQVVKLNLEAQKYFGMLMEKENL